MYPEHIVCRNYPRSKLIILVQLVWYYWVQAKLVLIRQDHWLQSEFPLPNMAMFGQRSCVLNVGKSNKWRNLEEGTFSVKNDILYFYRIWLSQNKKLNS